MKRQKITSSEITKQAIKLFSQKGIENVSMNEIANSLGITKPTLYYYFKNKDDIVKHAFVERANEMKKIISEIEEVKNLREFIIIIIEKHLEFFSKNDNDIRCFFRILNSDYVNHFEKMANEMIENNRKIIRVKIEDLIEKENFNKDLIDTIVIFISSLITYLIMELKMKRKINVDVLKKVVDVFLKGVKVLIFSFIFTLNLSSQEINIDDAIKISFEKNISLQNALIYEKIYLEKINEYYGTAYPQINVTASYVKNFEKPLAFMSGKKIETGLENSYSASISVNQILWSGGRVGTAIELAKDYAETSRENVKLSKNSLKRSVKQLFYSILYAREMVKLKEEMLLIEREHFKINEEKYLNGLVSDLVVMRSNVDVSNRELELIKAKNVYDIGLLTLKDMLGINIDEEIKLNGSFDVEIKNFDFNTIYSKALQTRPDYKIALLKKAITEKQVRIEKGNHLPIISAFLNRQFSGQNEKNSFPPSNLRGWSLIGGITLNLSVFNGLATSSRIKQLDYEVIIREKEIKDLERKIKIEIKRTLLDMEEITKRLKTQELSVKNAKKILESTEKRYKEGISSQLELNDATLLYSSAKFGYLGAIFDYLTSLNNLEYIVGGEI
ncbi:MAG: TolC family protein [Elusimicrobiales bacterium]|nr:TolC family protein [Elusimicrobiales bacterium]